MKRKGIYAFLLWTHLVFAVLFLGSCDYAPVITELGENQETTQSAGAEKKDSDKSGVETKETTQQIPTETSTIYVHVCGSVKSPGLYELPAGSRVDAAVKAAGGFLKDARQSAVNLAEALSDGIQIYVPSQEEVLPVTADDQGKSGSTPLNVAGSDQGLININTAGKEELMNLSGIGEGKAAAIIEYRETNGSFQSVEDIKNVSGIGDATFQKIKEAITI